MDHCIFQYSGNHAGPDTRNGPPFGFAPKDQRSIDVDGDNFRLRIFLDHSLRYPRDRSAGADAEKQVVQAFRFMAQLSTETMVISTGIQPVLILVYPVTVRELALQLSDLLYPSKKIAAMLVTLGNLYDPCAL